MIIRFHCLPWNREMELVIWLCKLTNIHRTALSNIVRRTHTQRTRARARGLNIGLKRFDQWIGTRVGDLTKQFRPIRGYRSRVFVAPTKNIHETPWCGALLSRYRLIYHHAWHASTGLKLTFINSIPCRGMYTESSIQLGSDYTTYRRTGLRNRMRTFLVNES